MNAPSEIQKETKSNIRRVFLVSTNGNIYESSLWSSIGPIYNSLRNDRDGYRTNARNQWWAFAYWEIKAALLDVSIASLDNLPSVWSFCVSGSNNCSTNDGFVPVKDNFYGKELSMVAPGGDSRDKYDLTIELANTSHIDYASKTLAELSLQFGRSGSRNQSVNEQKNAIRDSIEFIK